MRSLALSLFVAVAFSVVAGAVDAVASTPPKAASTASGSTFAEIAAETDRQIPNVGAGSAMPAEIIRGDLEDYAAYVKWQREFARQSWAWHLFSTKLLLFVVMSIVAFGLLITYLQFTRDARKARRGRLASASTANAAGPPAAVEPEPSAEQSKESSLKLGPAGLEVTSLLSPTKN